MQERYIQIIELYIQRVDQLTSKNEDKIYEIKQLQSQLISQKSQYEEQIKKMSMIIDELILENESLKQQSFTKSGEVQQLIDQFKQIHSDLVQQYQL
ncbi:hypothetical protein pb186bvf_017193 [Paramecium bursaria]